MKRILTIVKNFLKKNDPIIEKKKEVILPERKGPLHAFRTKK